jgi:hypothetical protein
MVLLRKQTMLVWATVDILSPSVGNYFFVPDLRGKSPSVSMVHLVQEVKLQPDRRINGTATGDGGLFTNFIIRSRREADALVLTGHNHDSRYLRKDVNGYRGLGTSSMGRMRTLQVRSDKHRYRYVADRI